MPLILVHVYAPNDETGPDGNAVFNEELVNTDHVVRAVGDSLGSRLVLLDATTLMVSESVGEIGHLDFEARSPSD